MTSAAVASTSMLSCDENADLRTSAKIGIVSPAVKRLRSGVLEVELEGGGDRSRSYSLESRFSSRFELCVTKCSLFWWWLV